MPASAPTTRTFPEAAAGSGREGPSPVRQAGSATPTAVEAKRSSRAAISSGRADAEHRHRGRERDRLEVRRAPQVLERVLRGEEADLRREGLLVEDHVLDAHAPQQFVLALAHLAGVEADERPEDLLLVAGRHDRVVAVDHHRAVERRVVEVVRGPGVVAGPDREVDDAGAGAARGRRARRPRRASAGARRRRRARAAARRRATMAAAATTVAAATGPRRPGSARRSAAHPRPGEHGEREACRQHELGSLAQEREFGEVLVEEEVRGVDGEARPEGERERHREERAEEERVAQRRSSGRRERQRAPAGVAGSSPRRRCSAASDSPAAVARRMAAPG